MKIDWKKLLKKWVPIVIMLIILAYFGAGKDNAGDLQQQVTPTPAPTESPEPTATVALEPTATPKPTAAIDEDGWYYSKEEVALYIHTYGRLPDNFISKEDAEELGWTGGNVEKFKKGGAIGGSRFGNREGLLPKASGRQYYECDIDTNGGKSRGAKRIVYSNDALIFYTDDHYESFTPLYGEED